MKNVALLTGASSGIGRELARVHAERGGDLVLVARREDRLEALKAELEDRHGVTAVVLARDLAPTDAAEELYRELDSRQIRVDVLINNAGFGGHGFFHQRDWDKDKAMIQLNVLTLVGLTRLFLPQMVERQSGKVLNVASLAGFLPGPLQAVYYATKAFVLSFSEAVANELSGTGVTVTALCPGVTETGFFAVADLEGARALKSGVASARDVAVYGYEAMLKGKPVAVHGARNRFTGHLLLRLVPRSLVTRISRLTLEKD